MNEQYQQMSLDELLGVFSRKFFATHEYNLTYLPSPLTKEWLVDQLHALEWYCGYEQMVKTKERPADTITKKVKVKSTNPFI